MCALYMKEFSFVSFVSEMILAFVRNDFIKSMKFSVEVPIYAIALAEVFQTVCPQIGVHRYIFRYCFLRRPSC